MAIQTLKDQATAKPNSKLLQEIRLDNPSVLEDTSGNDNAIFQFILYRAQQGDGVAQLEVGNAYYFGQFGLERNFHLVGSSCHIKPTRLVLSSSCIETLCYLGRKSADIVLCVCPSLSLSILSLSLSILSLSILPLDTPSRYSLSILSLDTLSRYSLIFHCVCFIPGGTIPWYGCITESTGCHGTVGQ